jgi:hypothetical protein
MPTKTPTSEEQFIIYYDRLRDEINKAYTHHEIAKALREMRKTRRSEFSEALTFFSLTMNAHLFETIMSIGRFVDTRGDSLHLNNFFRFIEQKKNLFSSASFKQRLLAQGHDNDYCEHFAQLHTDVTEAIVAEDRARIASLPVGNLIAWRHKKLAHIEKRLITENVDIMKEKPVTIQEIDTILITIHEILNRYRIAFDGTEWILGLPPAKPQIEYVMDALSHYRQSRKQSRNGLIKESKQK